MENHFTPKMAVKTTEELTYKVANWKDYAPEAILACLWELKKRNELLDENTELLQRIERHAEQQKVESKKQVKQLKRESKETAEFWIDFLTFRLDIKVVPGILYLCIIMYSLMLIFGVHPMEPSPYDLLAWGGNLTQLSFGYQPWRLITHIFLHGSIIHILMNMAILLYIGPMVELMVEKKWLVLAFLLTGIGGGIASAAWNYNIVSVGASGAIFGLYGLTLGLVLTSKDKALRKSFISSILIFVGYNALFGLTRSGIDNAAHFGGLGTGIIFGLVLGLTQLKNKPVMANNTQANKR